MAKFYGTLNDPDCGHGVATKCGYHCMKASAQSYDGSIISKVYYDNDILKIKIELSDKSNTSGDTYFDGTMSELKAILKGDNNG